MSVRLEPIAQGEETTAGKNVACAKPSTPRSTLFPEGGKNVAWARPRSPRATLFPAT
jgi:hypothetical protein